jgi:ATP-dependent exoDNAse (exonuclease V) beta subunit
MPEPWQSLAYKNEHPRDKSVRFTESTHTYHINGSSKGIVSTTGFVHSFFGHFDADAAIAAMRKSPKWPQHEHYGKTDDEIKAIWEANRDLASGTGTKMHLAIEQYLNEAFGRIDPKMKETKEWEYFLNFWRDYSDTLEPYRTEWEVWDDKYLLTGSIDMVFKDKKTGEFHVYDWKRSKEIKRSNPFQSGLGPASHMDDTNLSHYTLQLNVYRWFLETHYGLKIKDLCLIILHPNNANYLRIPVPRLEKEIQGMLAARAAAVAAGCKVPVVITKPDTECLLLDDD